MPGALVIFWQESAYLADDISLVLETQTVVIRISVVLSTYMQQFC